MGFFTKSAVVIDTPRETAEIRLAAVEQQWRKAEAAYTRAALAVAKYNSSHRDLRTEIMNGEIYRLLSGPERAPERQRLEAEANRGLAKRNELLAERADLLQHLGRIR